MYLSDFDEAYSTSSDKKLFDTNPPVCVAPQCFIGSYPPVTPAGQVGPFFVNTYYLQPGRKLELAGPVTLKNSGFSL